MGVFFLLLVEFCRRQRRVYLRRCAAGPILMSGNAQISMVILIFSPRKVTLLYSKVRPSASRI